jgi:hypothetical protein
LVVVRSERRYLNIPIVGSVQGDVKSPRSS